jgi:hypothetical protein
VIHNLGPVCMFECSKCKERYVGPESDKRTKTWKTSHGKNHWLDSKGRPTWE